MDNQQNYSYKHPRNVLCTTTFPIRHVYYNMLVLLCAFGLFACNKQAPDNTPSGNTKQITQESQTSQPLEIIPALARFSGGKMQEVVGNIDFSEFTRGYHNALQPTQNSSPTIEQMSQALADIEKNHQENKQVIVLDQTNQTIVSYALGYLQGTQLQQVGIEHDPNDFLAEFENAYVQGVEDFATLSTTIETFFTALQEQQNKELLAQSIVFREENEAFLVENSTKDGVKQTPSGLQYKILVEGSGTKPQSASDEVRVHYKGTLIDGKEFDSSYNRGEPTQFALNQVIPGWTEGVQLMTTGSTYRFFIPAELGYGTAGAPPSIPPYATLIFDVELIDIL